jgi:hypothetical protein
VTFSLACNSLRITCRASSSENALSIDWRPPGGRRESRKRASEVGGATCKADPALVVSHRRFETNMEKEALKRGNNLRRRLHRPHPQLLAPQPEFVPRRRREAVPLLAHLTARLLEGEKAARYCRPPRADSIMSSTHACGGWHTGTLAHWHTRARDGEHHGTGSLQAAT